MNNSLLPRAFVPLIAWAGLSLCACSGSQSHPLIGKPAPEITAEPVVGEGPKTLQAALGKVVILDFWATYCIPCKKSFPKYQEIVDRFPRDVAVIAVSVDEPDSATKSQVIAFAKENHAKFAIVWDKDRSTSQRYGKPPALPWTFILDKSGTVRHQHAGTDEGRIADEVKGLLDAAGGRAQ